ncbi:hypothetical protein A176_006260 [Myxococcus hansupus]|uniref:Uncharacterized protein n=1 Tax=Pseudomyxococcus hansupus TaxID=1297742 RepID=A0A0H4X617_9BACT|nr:hypothetical protein [Myxococcus hansupus]AKQ69348.1 hypothetical protein A176_006260 [Myxococcus hansupus]
MSRSRDKGDEFQRQFEGAPTLDGLLDLAGSSLNSAQVLERMREALGQGVPVSDVIPSLFDEEPRFPSPDIARRLYQNLLGLWDLVEEGKQVRMEDGARPPRPKKVKATAPAPFHPGVPTSEFVEGAWRYLEDDEKTRTRFTHAFENRQDALLGALDAAALTDEGYGVARHLLLELYAMLELGWPPGLTSVNPAVLEADTDAPPVPQPLKDYADEALFEAEQDEEQPLSSQELEVVRRLVHRGLAALWGARKER